DARRSDQSQARDTRRHPHGRQQLADLRRGGGRAVDVGGAGAAAGLEAEGADRGPGPGGLRPVLPARWAARGDGARAGEGGADHVRQAEATDSKRARNQAARRQRVIEAAVALASDGGYDAVQMRDVAGRADVALGTLYRYFPSKDHLLIAALAEQVTALQRR